MTFLAIHLRLSRSGTIGIMVSIMIWGLLFDATIADGGRYFSGPFVFIGLLNAAVLFWVLIVAKKSKIPCDFVFVSR